MKVIDLYQCIQQKDFFIDQMMQDKVFVYPTDSLYGIWWLFTHENIEKIAIIKKRHMGKKMNIIAPSFEWIFDNFSVKNPEFILRTFNTYHAVTFILSPKEVNSTISLYETEYDNDTIGVRIIKHPFQEIITKLWKPFISTSANFAWWRNIRNIDELDGDIFNHVDYVIDWHDVAGIPSVLIFDDEKKILKRE